MVFVLFCGGIVASKGRNEGSAAGMAPASASQPRCGALQSCRAGCYGKRQSRQAGWRRLSSMSTLAGCTSCLQRLRDTDLMHVLRRCPADPPPGG